MAKVYSLICWGGRTGKTVSISASTDVVTLTKHGLRNGTKLWPSGTLPAELNSSTPVYARSTGANTFTLHASEAGAVGNTEQIVFTGSSTYAAVVLKSDFVANPSGALSPYGLSDLSRWGASGSERIYDGRVSCNTARTASGTIFDDDEIEIAEAFDDVYATPSFTWTLNSASVLVHSKIAGKRTGAFHYGVKGAGYIAMSETNRIAWQHGTIQNFTIDGFSCVGGYQAALIPSDRGGNTILNIIAYNTTVGSGTLFNMTGTMCRVMNCRFTGGAVGVAVYSYQYGMVFANNTVDNNSTNGIYSSSPSSVYGKFYNNVVYNNGINWNTATPANLEVASGNTGQSGDSNTPWTKSGGTYYTVSSADFNADMTLKSTSALIDAGTEYIGRQLTDIRDAEVPNYNNGGSEGVDVGCYEFDHGYGNHPASATISLTSIVSGSRVLISKASDGTVIYNDIPGTSLSFNTSHIGDFNVVVRKASASPFYREFNASGTTVANQTTTIKCLQQLDE